ncbi:MAG: putative bifunctional diguanylate cyclase/phosphodiesterase [Oceanisphaera sp.]|uniref:putative bifunctional diguanylate cyclase/phosphodiesterase n=1 Tax=Oceanisphaera sp. TaxID=1929979 RepID=UPI003F951626
MKHLFSRPIIHSMKGVNLLVVVFALIVALVFVYRFVFLGLEPTFQAPLTLYFVCFLAITIAMLALLAWFFVQKIDHIHDQYEMKIQNLYLVKKKVAELEMALNAHAIVAITDSRGVITQVNDNFCSISQYAREELVGHTHKIINSGFHSKEFFRELWNTLARNEVWNGDICNRAKDGSLYWVQSTLVPILGLNNKPERYIAIRADITAKKKIEAKNEYMALHDALTGLPNRRLMAERLAHALSQKAQRSDYGAVVLIDLDNFKEVNDMLGHSAGDELLIQAASRLSCNVRETDTVARFGGDEFVIIVDSLSSERDVAVKHIKNIGKAIGTALKEPYLLGDLQLEVTPSIGVALFNSEQDEPEELLKKADIALYAAKEAGRDQLIFFSPLLQDTALERALLAQDLRQAQDNKEFILFYQPIIDSNKQVKGVEALLRWVHPVHGMVSPGKFIPLAEEHGLIVPIGELVLETACKQLAEWQCANTPKTLTMAVNISVRQLNQANFVDMVEGVVARTGICTSGLTLEITESIFQSNVNSAITKINALRKAGIKFSLDDFGTGYSSLTCLKLLPIDYLKIDKSFVDDILEDASSMAIAVAIIALAKSLNISIIAEGVETPQQFDWLLDNGCHFFQGYLFSQPLHPNNLPLALEKSLN